MGIIGDVPHLEGKLKSYTVQEIWCTLFESVFLSVYTQLGRYSLIFLNFKNESLYIYVYSQDYERRMFMFI